MILTLLDLDILGFLHEEISIQFEISGEVYRGNRKSKSTKDIGHVGFILLL